MKRILKIGKYIVLTVLATVLLFSVAGIVRRVAFREEIPLVLGYGNAVIISGSMMPTISVGDVVVIRKQNEYFVNDIITFKERSHITHRIVERTENGYITKGDANNTTDPEITQDQIIGRVVWVIPKVGNLVFFLQNTRNLIIMALLGLVAIVFTRIIRRS